MLDIFEIVERNNFFPLVPLFDYDNKPIVKWSDSQNLIESMEALEKQSDYFSFIDKNKKLTKKKITGLSLITGEISGIMVIDLDRNHGSNSVDGISEYRKIIESLKLSEDDLYKAFNTFSVKTPNGGLHMYFNYKKGLKTLANNKLGIDIRTDKGLIVTPGSLRKVNKQIIGYQVHNNNLIYDMPDKLFNKLQEIYGLIKSPSKNSSDVNIDINTDKFYKVSNEGERDSTLFKYLCKIIDFKFFKEPHELYCIADMYNKCYLNPPLNTVEVQAKVNSAIKYAKRPYCNDSGRIINGALVEYILKQNPSYVKGNMIYIYNSNLGIYEYKDTSDLYRIYYDSIVVVEDKDSFRAEKFAKTIIQCAEKSDTFNYENRYINCINGIIDSKENKLLQFNSKYKLNTKFNGSYSDDYFKWKESFDTSKFKQFLKDVLIDDDVIITLQESWGLMLCPNSNKIQQVFIYQGSGSNGKSSIFDIQEALFLDKESSICGISLESFKDDRFILSMAEGKRVNIVRDDKHAKDIGGNFKSAVCGEPVTVNKKHKDQVRTRFNMAWFYGVNELPNTNDKTWGFYRRNCIIPFRVTFGTKDEVKSGKAKKIKVPNITDDIISQEIDIVFMWAYYGLQRLIKNNWHITPNKASYIAMEKYRENTDSVYGFYNNILTPCQYSKLPAPMLYLYYIDWCNREGRRPISKPNFKDKMIQFGHRYQKSSKFFYLNIDVKEDYKKEFNDFEVINRMSKMNR